VSHTKNQRGAIGARLRFEVLRRCNFACYYCGVPAAMGIKHLHVDHVIPVALGGTNAPWNLVAACWDCNVGKTCGVPSDDLIDRVRKDYCAYLDSTGIEAQPCAWCGSPVVRECPDGEDPLRPGQECGTCNDVFHNGYEIGLKHGWNRHRDGYDVRGRRVPGGVE
jgi:hypothetical protein